MMETLHSAAPDLYEGRLKILFIHWNNIILVLGILAILLVGLILYIKKR